MKTERKGGPRLGQKYRPRKPYVELECPWCGAGGRGNVMLRWHFDNCASKKTIEGINESN
jgi:hypothetical protein